MTCKEVRTLTGLEKCTAQGPDIKPNETVFHLSGQKLTAQQMETFKLRLPQGLPRRRNTPEMMAIAEGLWGHFDHLNAWKDWFVLVVGGGGGSFHRGQS